MAKVSVTNIRVNVNNFQAAYKSLGLGPIPPGTTVDGAVAAIQSALSKKLKTEWPAAYETFVPTQEDGAIMAPWSANVPGTAPKCVTDAVSLDFESWSLPVDGSTIKLMAEEITQQISNHGGDTGVFFGKSRITGSEVIQWGISFTTAVVVDKPEEKGILYAFAAVLSI